MVKQGSGYRTVEGSYQGENNFLLQLTAEDSFA